jgi:hypothetical protein
MDGALRALPPRRAPAALAPRVLAVLAARRRVPWYRRAWSEWPAALQAAFFVFATGLVGGLYAGAWRLSHVEVAPPAWLRPFIAIADALGILLKSLVAALETFSPWLLWGAAGVVALGGLLTLGLGTALVRLAQPRA